MSHIKMRLALTERSNQRTRNLVKIQTKADPLFSGETKAPTLGVSSDGDRCYFPIAGSILYQRPFPGWPDQPSQSSDPGNNMTGLIHHIHPLSDRFVMSAPWNNLMRPKSFAQIDRPGPRESAAYLYMPCLNRPIYRHCL
jgi:hypothetical protein